MKFLGISRWVALLVAVGAGAPACKDDPPAPPVPDSAKANNTNKKGIPPGKDAPRATQPKASPQANKEFFVDACVMGSWGLRVTRDTYLASLGGKEPNAELVPSFGDFPELDLNVRPTVPAPNGSAPAPAGSTSGTPTASASQAASAPKTPTTTTAATPPATTAAKASASAPPVAPKASVAPAASGSSASSLPEHGKQRSGQVPYARYFNRCRSAAGVAGAESPKLDAALKAYAEYLENLNKVLNPASAYYRNRQFEKDDFAKGKEYHTQLVDQFGKLDEKLDAVMSAYADWAKELKPAPDKVDTAGEISLGAVAEARALTLALLAKEPDAAAVKASIDKLKTAADKLTEEQKEPKDTNGDGTPDPSQFAKRVLPRLQSYLRIIGDLLPKVEAKSLQPMDRYIATAAYTSLVEIKNQALLSHLTQIGAAKMDPHGGGPRGPGGPGGPHGGGIRGPIPRANPPQGEEPEEHPE